MNREQNEELDDLFDIDRMEEEVKKVKRRSILKLILIILAIVLLIVAIILAYLFYTDKKARKLTEEQVEFLTTANEFYKYPNTIVQTSTEVEDNARKINVSEIGFKLLKDRFIPFTTTTTDIGSDGNGAAYPTIEINHMNKEKDGDTYRVGINNLTSGNRLAEFYHPNKNYKTLKQDLDNLNEMPKNTYLEMAISFDKAYSSEEVKEMLPSNIQPTFFWLDGYDLSKDIDYTTPTFNNELYGYNNPTTDLEKKFWTNKIKNEQDYIKQMKASNFYFYSNGSLSENEVMDGQGKSVYETLKNKSDKGENLVIGISVVATKEDLEKIVDAKYIRASSVGVISNEVDAENYYEQTEKIN